MNSLSTRQQIVTAADKLFYQQGFERTSFAHIADAVQISRGNFYHHFRTKDEILQAVIEQRLANTQKLLEQWEADADTPEARIKSFINILIMNRVRIKRYGCPVGTLCSELAKLDHGLQTHAQQLFALFRTWLSKQFKLLGCKRDADALAMHLLARSQGIATLANAFHDDKFIKQEVQHMYDWLATCITATP